MWWFETKKDKLKQKIVKLFVDTHNFALSEGEDEADKNDYIDIVNEITFEMPIEQMENGLKIMKKKFNNLKSDNESEHEKELEKWVVRVLRFIHDQHKDIDAEEKDKIIEYFKETKLFIKNDLIAKLGGLGSKLYNKMVDLWPGKKEFDLVFNDMMLIIKDAMVEKKKLEKKINLKHRFQFFKEKEEKEGGRPKRRRTKRRRLKRRSTKRRRRLKRRRRTKRSRRKKQC